jgi:putative Holliday junction resolvase
MGRLLAIDYGLKRTGLAVTDPLKIIATALETVPTSEIFSYLQQYIQQENVEAFVVGMPKGMRNEDTDITKAVERFSASLQKKFPEKPVYLHDERFTSKMALDALIAGGTSKKYRRKKENIDKVSAVIILQSFLETK